MDYDGSADVVVKKTGEKVGQCRVEIHERTAARFEGTLFVGGRAAMHLLGQGTLLLRLEDGRVAPCLITRASLNELSASIVLERAPYVEDPDLPPKS